MHRLSQFLPLVWGQGACSTPLKRSVIFVCFQESDCFTAVENNSCLGNRHGSLWKQCGADKYTQLEIRVGVSACHHCCGALSRAADAKCCLTCRGVSCSSQMVACFWLLCVRVLWEGVRVFYLDQYTPFVWKSRSWPVCAFRNGTVS